MRKKFSLVSLVLAFVLFITACASSNGNNNNNNEGSQGNNSSPTPKTVNLTIGLPGSYDVTSKDIIDGFIAAHPHIKVTVQEAPWGDFTSKIATQIAGNTMPDLWFQENATILGYGKRGVAEDLAPYIERDLNEDDYIEGLFSARTPEGQVWGVPHGINPVALAYNIDAFEDAGVDLPTDDWTYEDLIETAKQLTVKDGNDVTRFGYIGSFSITTGWYPWIKQSGGSALDETMTQSRFDDPKTIAGLQQLYDGIAEGYFSNIDYVSANGGEREVFASGKGAMYMMQYSLQVNMNESFPDANWDVVKVPKAVDGNRYVPMVANTWLISSRANQDSKDAAWEFLKYYLGEESQKIVAESGSTLPVLKSANEIVENSTTKPLNKKAYTEGIAEGGVTLDENASWAEWRILVQQVVNEIVKGNVGVEEGALEIHEKVQEVLDANE